MFQVFLNFVLPYLNSYESQTTQTWDRYLLLQPHWNLFGYRFRTPNHPSPIVYSSLSPTLIPPQTRPSKQTSATCTPIACSIILTLNLENLEKERKQDELNNQSNENKKIEETSVTIKTTTVSRVPSSLVGQVTLDSSAHVLEYIEQLRFQ